MRKVLKSKQRRFQERSESWAGQEKGWCAERGGEVRGELMRPRAGAPPGLGGQQSLWVTGAETHVVGGEASGK